MTGAVLGVASAGAQELAPPDAAAVDPALSAPLPPLEQFDVQPAPVPTAEVTAERPTSVRYDVAIDGLPSGDLRDQFRSLSTLEEGEGDPVTGAQIDARIEEDRGLIDRLLRSDGYYAGQVDSVTEPVEGQAGRLLVSLTVTPGTRYRFDQVRVDMPSGAALDLVGREFDLKPGAFIVANEVIAAEAELQLRLPEQGFPFAKVGEHDILLNDERAVGNYSLPLTPGPLSSFGRVRLAGEPVFDERHAQLLARFDSGERYDSRMAEDLRRAMIATGLYSTVAVQPVDTGVDAPDGSRIVNVETRVAPGPQRQLAASAGYATGEGLRVEGLWRHRNLFPPEGALTLRAVAGTREQRTAAEIRKSNWGQRDRALSFLFDVANETRDAYRSYTLTLGGRVARESTPIWQKRWTYAAGVDLVASRERDRTAPPGTGRRNFFTGALPLQVGYDRSNSLLDPTRGFRITARTSPEISFQSSGFSYVRSQIEGSGYFPFGDSFVLAGRARAGFITGAERDRIAPTRRFYAGGGGSVRGYGYQELGPEDEDGDPLGGRSLAEASIEARYRFGDYGAVAFVDAGQLYTSTLPTFSDLRYGVGVGARYYTSFGPIRLDVATPLGRRSGEPRVAVYVSIGQAF